MGYLGRLMIKTNKRANQPVEYGVYENDAAMIDDQYNGKSHIEAIEDIKPINYTQDFTPITLNAEGGEQVYTMSFKDGGVSTEKYEVVVYLELEEVLPLDDESLPLEELM